MRNSACVSRNHIICHHSLQTTLVSPSALLDNRRQLLQLALGPQQRAELCVVSRHSPHRIPATYPLLGQLSRLLVLCVIPVSVILPSPGSSIPPWNSSVAPSHAARMLRSPRPPEQLIGRISSWLMSRPSSGWGVRLLQSVSWGGHGSSQDGYLCRL